MQAKIYAPTVEQRREALKVADRFRPKNWLLTLGLYPALVLTYAWFKSGFTFPFAFDAVDLGVAVLIATGVEIYRFATKTDTAKLHDSLQNDDDKEIGPLQYRVTEAGFEWWQQGIHQLQEWDRFERFKATAELLILVTPGGGYWVVSPHEIGTANFAVIVRKLREQNVKEVADRSADTIASEPGFER